MAGMFLLVLLHTQNIALSTLPRADVCVEPTPANWFDAHDQAWGATQGGGRPISY